MGQLYLVRHGQAGTRDDYDKLSELGREQAAILGQRIANESLRFDEVLCGGLRRQRETAECSLGVNAPIRIDTNWCEFDLDAVYADVAPQLAEVDASFAAHYAELQRAVESGDAQIHRRWTAADMAVIRAWVEGRFPVQTETWQAFRERVHLALTEALQRVEGDQNVVVYTSATPIAIAVAHLLGVDSERTMALAGAVVNASVTVLKRINGTASLFQFNTFHHLNEVRLQTFR